MTENGPDRPKIENDPAAELDRLQESQREKRRQRIDELKATQSGELEVGALKKEAEKSGSEEGKGKSDEEPTGIENGNEGESIRPEVVSDLAAHVAEYIENCINRGYFVVKIRTKSELGTAVKNIANVDGKYDRKFEDLKLTDQEIEAAEGKALGSLLKKLNLAEEFSAEMKEEKVKEVIALLVDDNIGMYLYHLEEAEKGEAKEESLEDYMESREYWWNGLALPSWAKEHFSDEEIKNINKEIRKEVLEEWEKRRKRGGGNGKGAEPIKNEEEPLAAEIEREIANQKELVANIDDIDFLRQYRGDLKKELELLSDDDKDSKRMLEEIVKITEDRIFEFFTGPEYEEKKKEFDPVIRYIKEKMGLDPEELGIEYIFASSLIPDPYRQGGKKGKIEIESNYSDYYGIRSKMTWKEKKECDLMFGRGKFKWHSPRLSMDANFWKRLKDPQDPLHQHNEEFTKLYFRTLGCEFPDEYRVAVLNDEIEMIRPEAAEEPGAGEASKADPGKKGFFNRHKPGFFSRFKWEKEKIKTEKELARIDQEQREKIGFGLRNAGFFVEEVVDRYFSENLKAFAGSFSKKKGKEDRRLKRFFSALSESYAKDAKTARGKLESYEDIRKTRKSGSKKAGGWQKILLNFSNAGYLSSNILRVARTAADAIGISAFLPTRYIMAGATLLSRGFDAIKEARLTGQKAKERTRVEDMEKAAEEAWKIYESAHKAGGGTVNKRELDKAYIENLPADLKARLNRKGVWANATGVISTLCVNLSLKELNHWLTRIDKNNKISEGEKDLRKQAILSRYESFLKDADRIIGQNGKADLLAALGRYASLTGKGVVAAMSVETLYRSADMIINSIPQLHNLKVRAFSSISKTFSSGHKGVPTGPMQLEPLRPAKPVAPVAKLEAIPPKPTTTVRPPEPTVSKPSDTFPRAAAKPSVGPAETIPQNTAVTQPPKPPVSQPAPLEPAKTATGQLTPEPAKTPAAKQPGPVVSQPEPAKGMAKPARPPVEKAPSKAPVSQAPQPSASPTPSRPSAVQPKAPERMVIGSSDRGIKAEFNVALGKGSAPKQLERAFQMIAVDHMKDALGADGKFGDEEGAKSLNMAANLVKLAQGKGAAGIKPGELKGVVSWDPKTRELKILDHAKFNNVVGRLENHSAELWNKGKLKEGAVKHLGNIKKGTWEKIIHADGMEGKVEGHDGIKPEQVEDFGKSKGVRPEEAGARGKQAEIEPKGKVKADASPEDLARQKGKARTEIGQRERPGVKKGPALEGVNLKWGSNERGKTVELIFSGDDFNGQDIKITSQANTAADIKSIAFKDRNGQPLISNCVRQGNEDSQQFLARAKKEITEHIHIKEDTFRQAVAHYRGNPDKINLEAAKRVGLDLFLPDTEARTKFWVEEMKGIPEERVKGFFAAANKNGVDVKHYPSLLDWQERLAKGGFDKEKNETISRVLFNKSGFNHREALKQIMGNNIYEKSAASGQLKIEHLYGEHMAIKYELPQLDRGRAISISRGRIILHEYKISEGTTNMRLVGGEKTLDQRNLAEAVQKLT